jgi:hypothetical protein
MSFETNHSRTKYCGDSCRVKAFYARQPVDKPLPATPTAVQNHLTSLLKDLGISVTGATIATIFNYVANDRPMQERIISLLESIKQAQTKVNLAPLLADLDYLVDYVGAQVEIDHTLGPRMLQARQGRLDRLSGVAQAKQQKELAEKAELIKHLNSLTGPL